MKIVPGNAPEITNETFALHLHYFCITFALLMHYFDPRPHSAHAEASQRFRPRPRECEGAAWDYDVMNQDSSGGPTGIGDRAREYTRYYKCNICITFAILLHYFCTNLCINFCITFALHLHYTYITLTPHVPRATHSCEALRRGQCRFRKALRDCGPPQCVARWPARGYRRHLPSRELVR